MPLPHGRRPEVSERPTPETDAFFRTFADGEATPSHAEYYDRMTKLERERNQYKGLLIRLHNDLFVHHGGQAVREFKELFREENYN